MIKFIKSLFGFGSGETVKEILTPQAPYKIEPPKEVAVAPVKTDSPKKVKAISTPIKEGTQRANVKKPNPGVAKPPAPSAPRPKSKPKAKRK